MTTRRATSTKSQQFQKRCSGYAFACLLLFIALQAKSIEVAFGFAFFGVRLAVVSLGFLTFLLSGMVGVSTFFNNKSKFKGFAIRIVNAAFPDEEDTPQALD